jgi:hypothetical protein
MHVKIKNEIIKADIIKLYEILVYLTSFLVERYQHFGEPLLYYQSTQTEISILSEISISIYYITRHHIPENLNFNTHLDKNTISSL